VGLRVGSTRNNKVEILLRFSNKLIWIMKYTSWTNIRDLIETNQLNQESDDHSDIQIQVEDRSWLFSIKKTKKSFLSQEIPIIKI
jgi:hypothetical protein